MICGDEVSDTVKCLSCSYTATAGASNCPQCGEALSLRRVGAREPGQTLLDLNKFLVVAIVFTVSVVTLGLVLF